MGALLSYLFPADRPNQLQITDLAEVLQLLRRHGYSGVSYSELGLYLGLSVNTIRLIEADHKGDTGRRLYECLTKWLQKADDVQKKGGPTIYSLVSALRVLGENGVADGIDMEKHPACRILARYAVSDQSLVTALPQLAPLLHSEKLINEMVHIEKKEDMLLIEIVKAVCIDSKKLEVFAEILLQYTATMEIGKAIMSEYRKCNGSRPSNGNARPTQDEIYLPPCLTSKFKLMQVQLGSTFDKVESVMIEVCLPSTLNKIKNILTYYRPELKSQVAQCDNIHDILELVRKDCSLDDIELLKAIVNELDIENAKAVIQKYSDAIEEFRETELSKCLNEKFSYASQLQCKRITIFVDRNTNECTLNDVRRLSANTFHKLSPQNSRCIKLNVVKDDNSFTITCSFPLVLSEQLITAALNNIDVLKENKVKRLTIGYCTVYEVKDASTPTTTEIDEYISSLSASSGLMKQLMLSLSVQLINSKEEVTTLNEEIMTMKKEAKSLKEALDTKNKTLTTSTGESERFNRIAAETKQLQEKVSHLTELDEEDNGSLKEIKELSEEQLVLFQSIKKEESGSINNDTEDKDEEKVEKLQPAKILLQRRMSFEIETLRRELEKEQVKNATLKQELSKSKKDTEEKMAIMNSQLTEKDKQITEMRESKQTLLMENENLRKILRQEKPLVQIFKDDIYEEITIDHPLIIKTVQTRQFQRLKNIRQIGYTYQNIPKANYSRLQNSIGMCFFAGEYVKQLQRKQPELNITESDVLCVQIAALCYNLGHGPFSQIFEMFLDEIFQNRDKPWESLSETSVMMFDFMIEENDEVKYLLEKFLDDEDIAFIKELIHGARKGQRKGKEFLYEIVVNKTSGLDVCMIDSTTRDAAALGMKINFTWKVFLSKVQVRSENGERHIFFQKDDLKIYNDLFETSYILYRKLYYLRENRIAALIIKRILVKSNKKPIIRDGDRLVTISEATKSMSAFTQLDDSVLTSHDDDPEVQALLNCLDSNKSIGQIGYVVQTSDWHKERIKQQIVQSIKSYDISDHLIIDPIKNGYENHESLTQYYYTDDGKGGQWTHEWAQPPLSAYPTPSRIFLVSGNMDLIHEVHEALQELKTSASLNVETYSDPENFNLMPILETTEPKPLAAKDNDK